MKYSLSQIIIPLIAVVLGAAITWWINDYVNTPRIEYYSRPHYKIDDTAIGNVFLANTGRKADRNVTVIFNAEIPESNFKIIDLTSGYTIKNIDKKTAVIIEELKPRESADITYKDPEARDDIDIINLYSESSNVHYLFEKKWWHLSPAKTVFFSFLLLYTGGVAGYLLSLYSKKIPGSKTTQTPAL